ncbi:MAG: mevalonate 5-phosphate dehydratase small subunit [Methanolobus sp.]|nr:mevalonate 5-phosphate dehydratase small subunit [Methanolobus sp.]
MRVNCRKISRGVAEGQVLLTREAISFLGNVDPKTGVIVEPKHELFGQCIKDRVLVFPHGKGSTVGSYVLYQLIKNNVAPAAMINSESEPIVAVGAIISGIPLVDRMEQDPFKFLKDGDTVRVDGTSGVVETFE